jgi:YVTN family beta-propeller protein
MLTARSTRTIGHRLLAGAVSTALIGGSMLASSAPAAAAPLPAGEYVFVSVSDGSPTGSIAVVDSTSGEVVTSLPVNGVPIDMVTGPGNTAVYAITNDGVTAIDAQNVEVLGSMAGRVDPGYQSLALTSDGSRLFALDEFDNLVDVFEPTSRTLLASIPVDGESENPAELELLDDDSKLYVGNSLESQSVSVIDVAGTDVTATIPIPGLVQGMTSHPQGTPLYVASFGRANVVHVINTSTNEIEANWSVPNVVSDMLLSPDGSRLYVISSSNGIGRLDVLDTSTGAIVGSSPGFGPVGGTLDLSTDGGTLFVPIGAPSQVVAIDTTDLTVRELAAPSLAASAVTVVDITSPVITSPDSASLTAGVAASVPITTTGIPTPTLSVTGTLPNGLSFTDAGDGTGTLAGTPTNPGTYPLTVTATNFKGTFQQTLTVTVNLGPPTIVQATAGGNQTAAPGGQYPTQIVATVTDGAGNPLARVPVTFTVDPAGAASFSGIDSLTVSTGTDGTARAPFVTAGTTPGQVTVLATVTGLASATFPLTIEFTPGPHPEPPSAAERLAALGQALDDGSWAGRRLTPLVERAGDMLDRGSSRGACSVLRAFIVRVGVYGRVDQLSADQVEQYTTEATAIRDQVGCR